MAEPNYQSIGSESPELHSATSDRHGWQGDPAEPQSAMQTSHHWSRWNRRSNLHDLGAGTAPTFAADFFEPGRDGEDTDRGFNAGYGGLPAGEIPAAALSPRPFTGYSEDGIISGALAASEQSGNIGLSPTDRSP